jgi:integrase/recombinase XerD
MNHFKNYLSSRGYSETSAGMVLKTLTDFQRWCSAEKIEPEFATYNELLGFMQHLHSRKNKQRTIQMHFGHLSHYFGWLTEDNIRADNPVKSIKIQGVQRGRLYHVIPMDELAQLYEQIKGNDHFISGNYTVQQQQNHHSQFMHRVMFGLMIWQGLGLSELTNLKVTDVQLREGKIYIAGDRRSNERTLKLESVQILDLMEYLQVTRVYYQSQRSKSTDHLFINKRESHRMDNRLFSLLKLLQTFNPHITQAQQIRTSVITHWLKTHNLRQVQYMAGHRYVSSTEKYLINDLEDLQGDVNKFHPL